MLPTPAWTGLFNAWSQSTEEAIDNALVAADTMSEINGILSKACRTSVCATSAQA